MTMHLSRRGLLAGLAGATAATALASPRRAWAQEAAAPAAPSAPPVLSYRRAVGDLEVLTLVDGTLPFPLEGINTATPEEVQAALAAAYLDPAAPLLLPVLAHLIRAGDAVTLVDAGAGTAFVDSMGFLDDALASVGVAPGDVGRVLVTHMHVDHIGGMLAEGAAAFPNATVHVTGTDLAFWTDDTIRASAPEDSRAFFDLAKAVAAAYDGRIETHEGEADLDGGVSAVPLPGHTPGHNGYLVSSGSDQLLLWGDSTALDPVQFVLPEAGILFDSDSAAAAVTRRRILDRVSADRILATGNHMPFPGFGHVERKGDAYAWVPERWTMF